MSDETIRSKNRWALWLIIAITLGPLVPYALRSTGEQPPTQAGAKIGAQIDIQPGVAGLLTPSHPEVRA